MSMDQKMPLPEAYSEVYRRLAEGKKINNPTGTPISLCLEWMDRYPCIVVSEQLERTITDFQQDYSEETGKFTLSQRDLMAMVDQEWPFDDFWIEFESENGEDEIGAGGIVSKQDGEATGIFFFVLRDEMDICMTQATPSGFRLKTTRKETPEFGQAVSSLLVCSVLTMSCLGSPDLRLVREEGYAPKVNQKRGRKGKKVRPSFYWTDWTSPLYRPDGLEPRVEGTGSSHSYRYPVRGHWRKLQTGRMTWIRPHFRGSETDDDAPKRVYKV
jgi:hypothetical protein